MSAAPLIVLTAGGTGGHVFPAEALARVLAARSCRLSLVTDRRGTSYQGALAQIETHRLPVTTLAGSAVQRLRGGFDLVLSTAQARGGGRLRRLSVAAGHVRRRPARHSHRPA